MGLPLESCLCGYLHFEHSPVCQPHVCVERLVPVWLGVRDEVLDAARHLAPQAKHLGGRKEECEG